MFTTTRLIPKADMTDLANCYQNVQVDIWSEVLSQIENTVLVLP